MASWSLCISGDVQKLTVVCVGKDDTVADLKTAIHQKLGVQVDQQTLYFQQQLMRDDSVLSSVPELNDCAMVYLSRRPFSLTVCSWLSGSLEEVQITLPHVIQDRSVSYLKDIITQRFGVKAAVFICGGVILDTTDDRVTVCQHPRLTDGAKVFLHKVPIAVRLQDQNTSFDFYVPQGTNVKFLKQELAVKTGLTLSQIECGPYSVNSNKPPDSNYFAEDDHLVTVECKIVRNGWMFDLQRVDGTKVIVHAPGVCENTPIVKLRECVEKCTGVPTHQQRLTIGSTIVEDWDHENRMMFIGDYPNIHDGSLLYLVQLERGSRMKVKYNGPVKLVKNWPVKYCCDATECFVNHIKSFDDLMAKLQISSYPVNIVDSEGQTKEESVGADYVVEVHCDYWGGTEFCW